MKYLLLLTMATLCACATSTVVNVPANNSVQLAYTGYDNYELGLKNTIL